MKSILRTKTFFLATTAILLVGIFALPTVVSAPTTSCLTAGATGLTASVIATSGQKISDDTINAAGCDIGIYVAPGSSNISIKDNTVTGANQHGIFVQDSNSISITNNLVTGNGVNGSVCPTGQSTPGCIPEDKAIELVGTSNSIVSNNVVSHNTADGGIGIADDGATDPGAPNTHPGNPSPATNDVVKGNTIVDNSKGCGIVIAAYNAPSATSSANGNKNNDEQGGNSQVNDNSNQNGVASSVSNILVIDNTIVGTAPTAGQLFPPAGSYIGQIVVATDGPNAVVSSVNITGNNLDGSELPAIVVHSNVFGDIITGTQISKNTIAQSGYYPGLPAASPLDPGITQGTTGIALIAEIAGPFPPNTNAPALSNTNVFSNTILGSTNGVWLCGTHHTNVKNLQGDSSNPIVTCSLGGS